ncbi:hypothetical protein BH23BAC2_BH23BAC2_18000 [soil metagenome]
MANSTLNFEKFANDAHKYINELAEELGHPEEKNRVLIIWRSVMHTIRDRIHLGESLQIIAPLPMIFKGIYVEGWKYSEKPRLSYQSIEEMKEEVKRLQAQNGEKDFPWLISTEKIILITITSLSKFMTDDHLEQIAVHLPMEISDYICKKS